MKTPTQITALLACCALPALAALPQGRGAAPSQDPAAKAAAEAQAAALEKQKELATKYFEIADYDKNEWISFREARESLEVDRNRFLVYDADSDGRVTLEEYVAVSLETAKRYGAFQAPKPDPNDPDAQALLDELNGTLEAEDDLGDLEPFPLDAKSIHELFGRVNRRELREHGAPAPDQLVGPVFSFRRLDVDDDGGISREDLGVLLTGSGLDVRPNALIAALDTDGDGKLSEAEFKNSMTD